MATAVLVTRERDYGSTCYAAFRQRDLFPMVAATVEEAAAFLTQFKVDAVVLLACEAEAEVHAMRFAPHLSGVRVIVVPELPTPQALASRVRSAIGGELVQRAASRPD